MKPLKIVYWSRVGFGFFAALVCTLLKFSQVGNPLLTGISMALILYIVSYYVFKSLFATKVEKKSKLFTMGIGIYFLTWIVVWVLLSTLMHPIATFTHSPNLPIVGNAITFNASESYDLTSSIVSYKWDFGDGNLTAVDDPIIIHVYTVAENYTVTLTVEDGEGYEAGISKIIEVPAQ